MAKKLEASLLLHHGVTRYHYQHFAWIHSRMLTWVLSMIEALIKRSSRRKIPQVSDKTVALNAWRRIDRRTREAMRQKFLPELVESYEERVRAFIEKSGEQDVLVLHVMDPFQRLLLHGVCEFYNLTSITDSMTNDAKLLKPTRIRKKLGSKELPPNIRLVQFLRMAKEGTL